jgi:creatinine amidohydrolase
MPSRSFALADLTWDEVRSHLETDKRLILAIGACEQYGPHLPIGASTRIAEAIAAALSQEFGVLRAPTLSYGVNLATSNLFAGTATLRMKTLHRVLNELLAAWEDQGFEEIILITAHGYEPHIEALATVNLDHTRVRVIDLLGIDVSHLLDGDAGPEHGGEVTTALLLHLWPETVRLERAQDAAPARSRWGRVNALERLPQDSAGSVGYPSLATPEKGSLVYRYVLEKIRERVFGAAPRG